MILYCFIARLITTLSDYKLKRDPFELAEKFFKKTVLPYALNDITDFITEMDSEDGAQAVKRRDPADLNDYVFMQLLEKRFIYFNNFIHVYVNLLFNRIALQIYLNSLVNSEKMSVWMI